MFTCVYRHVRCSHHGAEPAHRHSHRLWAGQGPEANQTHAVPGRRGNGAQSHGGCGRPGQGQKMKGWHKPRDWNKKTRVHYFIQVCLKTTKWMKVNPWHGHHHHPSPPKHSHISSPIVTPLVLDCPTLTQQIKVSTILCTSFFALVIPPPLLPSLH